MSTSLHIQKFRYAYISHKEMFMPKRYEYIIHNGSSRSRISDVTIRLEQILRWVGAASPEDWRSLTGGLDRTGRGAAEAAAKSESIPSGA